MNTNKLTNLIKSIIALKTILKCPICLDVMQDVLELDCGHKYCKECYMKHKSSHKQSYCPLCKRAFKRRSLIYTDTYANTLGKFVYSCCENIKTVYKCEVEQLQKQLTEGKEIFPQDKKNILQQNVTTKNSLDIPSTSKPISPRKKQAVAVKKKLDKSLEKQKVYGSGKESSENAFDRLINAQSRITFNKRGTKRVYTNKKKKEEPKYNILEFDNYENKTAVLKWLHDTRNKFDRLSQTQYVTDKDICEVPTIDLASISQCSKTDEDIKPISKNLRRGRAKSLDIEIKKQMPTQKKRLSHTGSVNLEDYNIEDINTEEEEVVKKAEKKVIQNLIEDEFLDTLETELQDDEFEVKSKRYQGPRKKRKPLSPKSSSGWGRLTKINKTIMKNEKVPKQLNITLQSTQEFKSDNKQSTELTKKTNRIETNNILNCKKILKIPLTQNDFNKGHYGGLKQNVTGNQKINIENRSRPPEDSNVKNNLKPNEDNIISEANQKRSNTYDFNQLEDYITKNIEIIDKSTSENNITLNDDIYQNQKLTTVPPHDEEVKKHCQFSENVIKEDKHQKMDVDDLDNEKLITEEIHPLISENEAKKSDSDSSCVLLDVIFNMPTQKNTQNDGTKSKQEDPEIIVISDEIGNTPQGEHKEMKAQDPTIGGERDTSPEAEIGRLYACPTQKMQHNEIIEHSSMENLLCIFETCLETCIVNLKSADMVVGTQLQNLKVYLSRIKSLTKGDNEVKENPVVLEVCDAEAQISVDTSEKRTQTEDNKTNAGVQTENLHCINCNFDLNILISQDTKKAVESMIEEVNEVPKNPESISQNSNTKADENKEIPNDTTFIPQNTKTDTESMLDDTKLHFHPAFESTVINKNNLKQESMSQNTNTKANENKEIPNDTACIPQNTKTDAESMLDDTKLHFHPAFESTVINKNNTQGTQNGIFTCTLDNFNFDTQEISKNQDAVKKISSQTANNSQKKNAPSTSKQNNEITEITPGSVLMCSLDSTKSTSKKVNRKLTYDADKSTKFKRIRPMSDSDSEDEAQAKRKCNRFLRDDLTVEILTNHETADFTENKKSTGVESQDSDNINYDEYLAKIMKKYEDNNFSKNSPLTSKQPKILSQSQDIIERCEELIENATKNKNQMKPITEVSAVSSKDSFRTASDSIGNVLDDEVFMDEDNLKKLENDIRAYEKNTVKDHNSEISDIIGESEEIEPLPKIRKKNVVKIDHFDSKRTVSENEDVLDKQNLNLENEGCMEFEEGDVNKISNMEDRARIKILANVKIKSQDKGENLKEDDDMFSDEDIVETTPQKKVDSFAERNAHSQILNAVNLINNDLPDPLTEVSNFDFDNLALPPPPDFQDDVIEIPSTPDDIENDNQGEDDITITNLDNYSLTPDHLSQFMVAKTSKASQILPSYIRQCTKENEGVVTMNNSEIQEELERDDLSVIGFKSPDNLSTKRERKLSHSTPIIDVDLTRETLGFSPIQAKKSQKMGIMEMAQAAKYTPLTSKQTPQKQNLLTSTPRQKSILNYITPSQSKEAEAPPAKTKPCIACTRLTKEQVHTVSQLTNKKLATYNPQFDSSVTHMIVAVKDDNCVKDYTIKFVSAVAAGIWVLRFEWIEECMAKNCIVPEEPYEVLDISGTPSPKLSRLTSKKNPLFKGYTFFCAEPFSSTTRGDIEEILKMLGGKVVSDLECLLEDDGSVKLIIAEGHETPKFEPYDKWLEDYKTVTVDIDWLCKCVGQYKILSLLPFVLCSEDNLADLGDLGYPSNLTETVPLTFTETF